MTTTAIAACLEALNAAAKAASTAELDHQKQAARRAAELRVERAHAWRRLNLIRATAAAVRAAEDPDAVAAAGRATLLAETGWSGAAEAQREVADRFVAVAEAVRAACDDAEAADPARMLADFEAWYAAARGGPFLALMDREIVELPLVEIDPERPLGFEAWLGGELEAGPFTALVVLVAIGDLAVTPLRSTWFHVIGAELDWPGIARLLDAGGADWDGALFAPRRDRDGGPLGEPAARIAVRDLGDAVVTDRTTLNAEHFFDRHGRRMRVEEVPAQ